MSPGLLVRALRLPFVSASALPCVFGALLAAGPFRVTPFLLGLAAVLATHLAANLINDYADAASGADALDPTYYQFFGGSKLIQEGRLPARFYRDAAAACSALALAAATGLALVLGRPLVPVYLAAALCLAVSYSCGPLRLSYRRLGELAVMVLFGPAAMAAGLYTQAARLPTAGELLLALPFGFLTAGILVANEVPDAPEDARAGKHTLVGWLGAPRGFILFGALAAGAYGALLLALALGLLGWPALLALATLPVAWRAARILKTRSGDKAALVRSSKLAIALHAAVSIALIAGKA